MSGSTNQAYDSYIPVFDAIPDTWERAREFLVERLKQHANAINVRQIGWYLNEPVLSGKQFIPSATINQAFRTVYRLELDFGALPNAGTKSVAHGLPVGANFTLVLLSASASKQTTSYSFLPIPYASPTLNQNIQMNMDATNVNITTAVDYSAYTVCFVTIEYLLEV